MQEACFSPSTWSDLLYAGEDIAERKVMQKHLEAGCPECWSVINLLRSIAEKLRYETDDGPPALLSRSVNALHRRGGAVRLALKTVFDSATAPAAAEIRNACAASARQVLYLTDDFALHLQIDLPNRDSIVVVGQLVRHNGDPEPVADVPAFLSSGNEILAGSVSNRLGEFQLESPLETPVHLTVALTDEACLAVSLESSRGEDESLVN